MKPKLRLACVEYYNTLPFLHGLSLLESEEFEIDLVLAPPSECSRLYLSGSVDISLIPIGALDKVDNYRMLDAYCIGCDGAVDTVAVLSQVPIQSVQSLYLDPQSNTSNRLVQVLCEEHWKISPQYLQHNGDYNQETILAIGDKVFDLESKYNYKYDLGTEWKQLTGLPFVFAVWICKPSISKEITDSIESVFRQGMNQSDKWIPQHLQSESDNLMQYLTKNIVFTFDDSMQEGLNLFELKLQSLEHEFRNHTKQTE